MSTDPTSVPALRRLPTLVSELARRGTVAFVAAHAAAACSPSDFDQLTSGAERDDAACDAVTCLDGSLPPSDEAGSDGVAGGFEDTGAGSNGELDDGATDGAPRAPDAASSEVGPGASEDASVDASDAIADGFAPAAGAPGCDGRPLLCMADEQERRMEPCGSCNLGIRTMTRTCASDGCSWGAWSAWSECTAQPECDPSDPVQTQQVDCTTCGTKSQSRSCSPTTCTWGPWTDSSACTWCNACSEVVYCDTPPDVADRGTWCRQLACTREQALANCLEDVAWACGVTIEPFYMQYL